MLQSILQQLREGGIGSKAVAGLLLVAVIGIAAVGAVVAKKPHFELLYSELDGPTSGKIQKALAGAAIPFEVSQPPGPFIIYVDEADRYKAQSAVALSGALDRTPGGILPDSSGIASVFMSAGERNQVSHKRELQEMERLLEELEFVTHAKVNSKVGFKSAFGKSTPPTASVVLTIRGDETLTSAQERSVARHVRFGLGIEEENLTISDQRGVNIFDGSLLGMDETQSGEWLDRKQSFDEGLQDRANQTLEFIYGPRKAKVLVTSTWDHSLNTTISESSDPTQKVVLSESVSGSKTPQGTTRPVGGSPGTSSNLIDGGDAPPPVDQVAKTDQSKKEYFVPRITSRTVNTTPTLQRLSVSLFIDESLGDKRAELEESVKAAVGFDETRKDAFKSMVSPFAALELEGEEAGIEGEAVEEGPSEVNPMLELLLKRGVEIVSALAFLFILIKSLKSAPPTAAEPQAFESDQPESEDMLELLAQAQIDELVKSDPARVGQILSNWAGEEVGSSR